jgi:hypothetical protein
MKNYTYIYVLLFGITFSCISTKNTIKNINPNAPDLELTSSNSFVIKKYSTDPKYGYDPDYPINIFFENSINDTINQHRYLNALAGPNDEKLSYKRKKSCCPFTTKNAGIGAGMLDVYEITWKNNKKPLEIYFNIYEKGELYAPVGLKIKKLF